MPLQPGPFLQGSQADVAIPPGNYDFTADALTLGSQLGTIAIGWNSFLTDLEDLAQEPIDPTLGIDEAGLIQELAYEQGIADLPALDAVLTAINTTDLLFIAATSFAPAAAWTDPTLPFVPPDPTQTIVVPTVPIGDYNPLINSTVGGAPGGSLPSVTLQNTTRVGSLNFVVGDSFLVNVVATAGQPVSVDAVFNGADLGKAQMGTTDGQGNLALSGVEGPDQVGGWLENWYVGDLLVSTFSFIVSPS